MIFSLFNFPLIFFSKYIKILIDKYKRLVIIRNIWVGLKPLCLAFDESKSKFSRYVLNIVATVSIQKVCIARSCVEY